MTATSAARPTLPETEAELVAWAQAGSVAAWEALYAAHHPHVLGHLTRFMRNADDAHDLTADAFLKAWLRLPETPPGLRFSAWVHQIAHNGALDVLRHRTGSPIGETACARWFHLTRARVAQDDHEDTEDAVLARLIFTRLGTGGATGFGWNADLGAPPQPEQSALDAELRAEVRAVLDQLPQRYRRVLELQYDVGLCYAEMAQVMATTVASIKSLRFRAVEEARLLWRRHEQRLAAAEASRG